MRKKSKKEATAKPLTLQEESFIAAYVSNGGNGAAAVKTAGYKCNAKGAAAVTAARLLIRANVSTEIARRRAELRRTADVSAQEVIAVLAAHLRSDMTELLGKGGAFDLEHVRSSGLGRLIKKLDLKRVAGKPARVTPKGTAVKAQPGYTYVSKIELHSAQSAANQLCKVLGIEQERAKNKDDAHRLRALLEERIQFGIEGFGRGGVDLTRRDMLEILAKMPETTGDLYPLIQAELASSTVQ